MITCDICNAQITTALVQWTVPDHYVQVDDCCFDCRCNYEKYIRKCRNDYFRELGLYTEPKGKKS